MGLVLTQLPLPAPIDRGGICQIALERRIDPYGRETVHRIRVCDEGPVYPGYSAPTWSAVPPEYGYGRPPYYEPFSRTTTIIRDLRRRSDVSTIISLILFHLRQRAANSCLGYLFV